MKRDVSKKLHSMLLTFASHTFRTKDMRRMVAIGTDEDRHVLNHTQDLASLLIQLNEFGELYVDKTLTGTLTFLNMLIPLTASFRAMS